MADALAHTTILTTRPINQSAYLCDLLEQKGAHVIVFPTIEISAKKTFSFLPTIQQMNNYAYIIFTSANAVRHSAESIKHYWPSIPSESKFAAIGAGTKLALNQQGWECTIFPKTDYSSQGLLDLQEFNNITGKNILIITGQNGRDHLAITLKLRQARVTEIVCYQREMPKYSDSVIMKATKNNVDFIVCTSNEGLKNLAILLGDSLLKKFKNTQIIAFSNRINPLAKSLGFIKKPMIVKTASDEGIVATIIQTRESQ